MLSSWDEERFTSASARAKTWSASVKRRWSPTFSPSQLSVLADPGSSLPRRRSSSSSRRRKVASDSG